MASRKKKMPSTPNGIPNTAPYWRISPGHSRPISNDSTVPVTAPTAISTPMACDQRRASRIADNHANARRPAPPQPHRGLVSLPQTDELGEQYDRRERDAQAGQDDV